MTHSAVRLLFGLAGVYDFGIGLAFLLYGPQLFDQFGVPQPNHWGYIQFACLLLMIFGLMFFAVAAAPRAAALSVTQFSRAASNFLKKTWVQGSLFAFAPQTRRARMAFQQAQRHAA